VTAPSSSYTSMVMGGRGHKLQPLFSLVFRRSSVQHPLLAGALSESGTSTHMRCLCVYFVGMYLHCTLS
jgi:hypothetical protein